MKHEDISSSLKELVQKQQLDKKAIEACELWMKNSLKDDPDDLGGYAFDAILLKPISNSFVFEHYLDSTPYINIQIGLYKKEQDEIFVGGHENIGTYNRHTNLKGEFLDEWLSLT